MDPVARFDDDELGVPDIDPQQQSYEAVPSKRLKIGPFTVVCLILDRTVGSGIFVSPISVLNGTGSVGVSLIMWAVGGLVAMCGLLVWLELGLSTPQVVAPGGELKSVPRSGGEKNYLVYIYRSISKNRPKHLVTCMFGIPFIILGNFSGNGMAFGTYMMHACIGDKEPSKGSVIGWAIAGTTLPTLLTIVSRKGGLLLNNTFAVIKVSILVVIIVLGFAKAHGENGALENFHTDRSFAKLNHGLANYVQAFLFIVYSFTGFEQPFYVLHEVRSPRKTFPRYTVLAMGIVLVLYMLVNISYLCVVPSDLPGLAEEQNMALLFFRRVFNNDAAPRVMSGIIAFSIFGNILAMTYTASRVKQEIAKEGIIPRSLFFSASYTTPYHWWKVGRVEPNDDDPDADHTPMPALLLHWLASMFMIAVTSMLESPVAYNFLVSLYSYTLMIMTGFFTAAGLVYLGLKGNRRWHDYSQFHPLGGTWYGAVYALVCGFLLFAAFAPPRDDSPFGFEVTKIKSYVVPVIGLSAPFWGVLWYFGLRLLMQIRGKILKVSRLPCIKEDEVVESQWILKWEIVTHEWHSKYHPTEEGLEL